MSTGTNPDESTSATSSPVTETTVNIELEISCTHPDLVDVIEASIHGLIDSEPELLLECMVVSTTNKSDSTSIDGIDDLDGSLEEFEKGI